MMISFNNFIISVFVFILAVTIVAVLVAVVVEELIGKQANN